MKREEFVKRKLVGVISQEWPCSFCHGGRERGKLLDDAGTWGVDDWGKEVREVRGKWVIERDEWREERWKENASCF